MVRGSEMMVVVIQLCYDVEVNIWAGVSGDAVVHCLIWISECMDIMDSDHEVLRTRAVFSLAYLRNISPTRLQYRILWCGNGENPKALMSLHRLENMRCPRPRYHSMPVITMQINHDQVAGILNKAYSDPARSCTRIVSVWKFLKFSASCWSKVYKTWHRRLVKESYGWDSTLIECGGPAKVCEPNPQMLLWAIRKVQGLMKSDVAFERL